MDIYKFLIAEEQFPILFALQFLVNEIFDQKVCESVLSEFSLNYMDSAEMYIYKLLFYPSDDVEFVFAELNGQQLDCIDYRFLFRLVSCMELQDLLSETHQQMMKSMLVVEEQNPLFSAQYLVKYPKLRAEIVKMRFEIESELSFNEFIDLQHELLSESIDKRAKPLFFQYSKVDKIKYLNQLLDNGSMQDFFILLEFKQLNCTSWDQKEQQYLDELGYIKLI